MAKVFFDPVFDPDFDPVFDFDFDPDHDLGPNICICLQGIIHGSQ